MGEKKRKKKYERNEGIGTVGARASADRSKSVRRFRTGNGPGFTLDGQIVSMKIAMAPPR